MAATRRARIVRDSQKARTIRRHAEWSSTQRRIARFMRAQGFPLMPWQRDLLDRIRPGRSVTAFGRPVGTIESFDATPEGLIASFAITDEPLRAYILGSTGESYSLAPQSGEKQ